MRIKSKWLLNTIVALLSFIIMLFSVLLFFIIYFFRTPPPVEIESGLNFYETSLGNSVFLINSEGVLVVDTLFWKFSNNLFSIISKKSSLPVKTIINTSDSIEHIAGNFLYFFYKPTVIVTENTYNKLKISDDRLITEMERLQIPLQRASEKDYQIKLGDQLIHLVSVGNGRNSSNSVVYFPKQKTVVTGDLFFNGYYPIVDHNLGGSYLNWISTLDNILALGPKYIVPGHGKICDVAEMKAFQGYLKDIVAMVSKMKAEGKTKDDIAKSISLPVHEARMKKLYYYIGWSGLSNIFNFYSYSSISQNAMDIYDELDDRNNRYGVDK